MRVVGVGVGAWDVGRGTWSGVWGLRRGSRVLASWRITSSHVGVFMSLGNVRGMMDLNLHDDILGI